MIFNPRRTCAARVTVVVWSVCVCMCVTANLGIHTKKHQMMGTYCIMGYGDHFKKVFSKNVSFKSFVSVLGDIQAPLSLLFQRRSILK